MTQEQVEVVNLVLQQGTAFASLVVFNFILLYFGKIFLGVMEKDLERRSLLQSRLIDIIEKIVSKQDS